MMLRKHFVLSLAVASMLFLVAASCGGNESGGGGEGDGGMPQAALASVLTESGFAAVFGQLQASGADLAIDDLREEGIADIEWVAREDAGESNTTALNALRRAMQNQPDIVLTPIVGTMVLAMRPEIERAQVPGITSAATRSITQDENQWIFRIFPHDGITKVAVAQFALEELEIERPAILADSTAFGQVAAEILTDYFQENGVSVVAGESVNPEDQDVSGQVSRIASANADALFVQVLTGTPAAVALKGIRSAGLDIPVFMPPGVTSPSTLELVTDDEVTGVYAEAVHPLDRSNEDVAAFIDRYKDKFDAEPDIFATLMYDAVRMFGQAVADGAEGPEEIWEAMSTMEYQGLAADFRSDVEGNLVHDVTVLQFKSGKTTEVLNEYSIEFEPREV